MRLSDEFARHKTAPDRVAPFMKFQTRFHKKAVLKIRYMETYKNVYVKLYMPYINSLVIFILRQGYIKTIYEMTTE